MQLQSTATFGPFIETFSLNMALLGSALLVLALVYIYHHKGHLKAAMFYATATLSSLVFCVLLVGVVAALVQSESHGRQHRQAAIEFWVCGVELQPHFSQHKQIHFDPDTKQLYQSGLVNSAASDATLGATLTGLGGDIQADQLTLPMAEQPDAWLMPPGRQDGDPQGDTLAQQLERFVQDTDKTRSLLTFASGQNCPSAEQPAELQVFVYELSQDGQSYTQQKIDRPDDYIIPRAATVPPGPCIIVSYQAPADQTNRLCAAYGIRDQQRCSAFDAPRVDDNFCYLRETERDN